MQFHYIGINYKNAGLSIRDKISFTDQKKMEFLAQMEMLGIQQCLILSTCNRSEVFYLDEEEQRKIFQINETSENGKNIQPGTRMDEIEELYISMFSEVDLKKSLRNLCGEKALLYFYRIAAGLESQVVGEDQILGQVRESYEFSRTQGHSGKELNRIAQDAIAVARRIKSEYRISEQPLSIAYIGIQHLNALCPIHGQRALVIGSGQTAALAVRYLYDYGASEVCVCSRNFAHAQKLQGEYPRIQVISYEKRYLVLPRCAIIISATSAPHLVLRREELEIPMASDTDDSESIVRMQVYLDLAAPRDIDPAIGTVPGVTLIDLDALQQVSDRNLQKREQLSTACQHELLAAVRETEEWLQSSRVDHTLATLQEKCDEIVEDSFTYLNRKIVFEPREQKILKRTLRASLNRLLREPIRELKQTDPGHQEIYEQVLRKLFHMDGSQSSE